MSKFICICGLTFTTNKEQKKHIELYNIIGHEQHHKIFKQNWKARILDCLVSDFAGKMLRVAGFYLIWFPILHHFDINFGVWESLLIGIGISLVLV